MCREEIGYLSNMEGLRSNNNPTATTSEESTRESKVNDSEVNSASGENSGGPHKEGAEESPGSNQSLPRDLKEMPEDLGAFFGHPLTAATTAINGEDHQASALALLHEYQNLPAIDRADVKIGDKYDSINDILKYVGFRWPDLPVGPGCIEITEEGCHNTPAARNETLKADDLEVVQQEYLMLLNTDVDAFLNRSSSSSSLPHHLSMKVLEEEESLPQDLSQKVVTSSCREDPLLNSHQVSPLRENSDFNGFDATEGLPLSGGIKQEALSESSSEQTFLDSVEASCLSDRQSGNRLQFDATKRTLPTLNVQRPSCPNTTSSNHLTLATTVSSYVPPSCAASLPSPPQTTMPGSRIMTQSVASMPPNVSVSELQDRGSVQQKSPIALQLSGSRLPSFNNVHVSDNVLSSLQAAHRKSPQSMHQTPGKQLESTSSSNVKKTVASPSVTFYSGCGQFPLPMQESLSGPPLLHGPHLPPPPRYEDLPARTHFTPSTQVGEQTVGQNIIASPVKQEVINNTMQSEAVTMHHKASDSTKKIIQALTEKLKRKQLQKQVSEHDSVSMNEITDLIQESLDRTREGSDLGPDALRGSQSAPPSSTSPTWPVSQHVSMSSYHNKWQAHSDPPTPVQCPPSFPPDGPNFPQSSQILQNETSMYEDSASAVYSFESGDETSPGPFARSLGPQTCGTGSPVDGSTAGSGMLVVISPQLSHTQFGSDGYPKTHTGVSTYDLKSPDSGFNETCVSPTDSNTTSVGDGGSESSLTGPVGDPGTREKILKRRRSSSASVVKQSSSNKPVSQTTVIQKIENDMSGYKNFMETNISTSQRIEEDRITYLNKGQFYGLSLEYNPTSRPLRCTTVKSVIMVVFRDEKSVGDELRCWEFWHSRQHSVKQRILDIDSKNSIGIPPNCIDEIAHNAVAIRWNPLEQPAKVSIAINCLSTDFSNQKGVKGLPLHIQIDTFEGDSRDGIPVHRSYCQVKVFCDKGAERKTRDEERRKEAKTKLSDISSGRKRGEDMFHPMCERSEFYSMADLTRPPILFNPLPEYEDYTGRLLEGFSDSSVDTGLDEALGEDGLPTKRIKREGSFSLQREVQRVLLYVREAQEQVFTALLLQMPTLVALAHAIEEKYNIPAPKIKNIYKRSKKGILVKMDDNILRHYSNESTFVISIKPYEEGMSTDAPDDQSSYQVTLAEIDADK